MDVDEALAVLADDTRDEPARLGAVAVLRTGARIEHLDRMFAVLERAETELALAISEALRAMNAQAVLTRLLRTGSERERALAAMRLVRLGDARAVPALLECARTEQQPRVRALIYEALARLSAEPGVAEALLEGLDDPDPDVRCHAAYGLGTSGAAAARAALEQRLEAENDDVAREFIERASRRLGGGRAAGTPAGPPHDDSSRSSSSAGA
ncbi:MAG: hypothetical protein KatS3mg102_1749 [Planctomycetota bacterium]|nr:MAG: hypothetical protein KatS3mg102_1749 [Planctomycetota bacterium]